MSVAGVDVLGAEPPPARRADIDREGMTEHLTHDRPASAASAEFELRLEAVAAEPGPGEGEQ